MQLKITSSHKTDNNALLTDIYISISEFYINVKNNIVSLRTTACTKGTELDEEGNSIEVEYPTRFMTSDPLYSCLNQERKIGEWAQNTDIISLTNTRYNIQANLLFELIFSEIDKVNSINPLSIIYELIDF